MEWTGKKIVLGVTGGIAAYKSADLVSRLRRLGAEVDVIMTRNATEFVGPATFQTLSSRPVIIDTFQTDAPWEVEHIALAQKADLFVIAPATANILAKMAAGIADDMLSTTVLATKAPVLVAPAMNTGMWTAPATRQNVATLKSRGVLLVGPGEGRLACGDTGSGRMSEPAEIVEAIGAILSRREDLKGLKVLVTAGGTRERLDPVRFLSNDSSGKMGFALAEAARDRGAEVTLVYGSVSVPLPHSVRTVSIESALDLYQTMMEEAPKHDIVIQAAAVADYRVDTVSDVKIKKKAGEPMTLTLVENPDIARAVGENRREGQTLVGFAAETDHLEEHARKKLLGKGMDLIVANDVTKKGAGFHTDTNIATLMTREETTELSLRSKRQLADDILDKVLEIRRQSEAV